MKKDITKKLIENFNKAFKENNMNVELDNIHEISTMYGIALLAHTKDGKIFLLNAPDLFKKANELDKPKIDKLL